jgi:hypothetical protein
MLKFKRKFWCQRVNGLLDCCTMQIGADSSDGKHALKEEAAVSSLTLVPT